MLEHVRRQQLVGDGIGGRADREHAHRDTGCVERRLAPRDVPAAYDFALAHESVHVAEHVSFVVAGLLVWTQIVAPSRHGRSSPGRRALFAVGILGLGMVLSEVLLLSGPLYAHYRDVLDRPFGLDAAEDQSRAALLMMGEQIATLGTAAALLLWTHVESVSPEPAATDLR